MPKRFIKEIPHVEDEEDSEVSAPVEPKESAPKAPHETAGYLAMQATANHIAGLPLDQKSLF